jgi:hypothetical protein
MQHSHRMLLVVDFVNHPQIANADTPSFPGGKLQAPGWPWVIAQGSNGIADTLKGFGGKAAQFSLGPAQDE